MVSYSGRVELQQIKELHYSFTLADIPFHRSLKLISRIKVYDPFRIFFSDVTNDRGHTFRAVQSCVEIVRYDDYYVTWGLKLLRTRFFLGTTNEEGKTRKDNLKARPERVHT